MIVAAFWFGVAFSLAAVIACALVIAPVATRQERDEGSALLAVLVGQALIIAFYCAEAASGPVEVRVVWDSVQLALDGIVGVLYLRYVARYLQRPLPGGAWLQAALVACSVLMAAWFATSPWHGRARAGAAVIDGGLRYGFEPGDYVMYALIYGLYFAGVGFVLSSAFSRHRAYAVEATGLTLGLAAPLLLGVLAMFDVTVAGQRDLGPFGIAVSALAITGTALYSRRLALVPMARDIVLDLVDVAVIVAGPDGRVVDLNAAADRLVPGLVVGDMLAARWPSSPALTGDERVRYADGERVWDLLQRPVERGFLLVGTDVTALARSNEELERRVAERTRALETAVEERAALQRVRLSEARFEVLGRLSASVAHDFNNLISVIATCSSLLESEVESEQARALLGNVDSSVEKAKGITRQLTSYSRRGVTGAPVALLVDPLITELLHLLRRVVGPDHRVIADLAAEGITVRVDGGQLEQVLMNLVINARDASPPNAAITIASRATDAEVELCVRDAGVGMSDETLRRAFEPYFTTKGARGTGLGLPNARAFAQAAGGVLELTSEVGRGTEVRLRLPRA